MPTQPGSGASTSPLLIAIPAVELTYEQEPPALACCEVKIQLPEPPTKVPEIKTDDPPGIERYWHERFTSGV